jgi:transcription initiation factor TFIID subunit TAF12
MARAKPYCPDCIQDPTLTAGPQGQCQHVYDLMDECMKAHRGNVADCVAEWKAFRDCHELSKKQKQQQQQQQQQQRQQQQRQGLSGAAVASGSSAAQASGPYVAGKR